MAVTGTDLASEWYSEVPRGIRRHVSVGVFLVVVVFGGFLVWAATAPLAAAIIAPGSFVATGNNKVIQHLEGGIIKSIMVREGDKVVAGQGLVELDRTAAEANARQLQLRQLRLEATLARLQAEARNLNEYVAPASVRDGLDDPEVRAINDSQRENFRSARSKLENEIAVLRDSMTALEFQKRGVGAQITALQDQRRLLQQEYDAKHQLEKRGILSRSAVRTLQRALASADGDLGRMQAEMSVTDSQIGKYKKEIMQRRDAVKQNALDQMQDVAAQLETVREQTRGATSILERTVIRAPVSGTVINMYYHTSGGVIESGKPIMELLPAGVPLIIEARVPRTQIDEVHRQQMANVRLTALNQRTTPTLQGKVIYVSADSVTESNGSWSEEVYLARVSIPNTQLLRVKGFTPTPGMPAEVMIQTQERTFFEYLTKPIVDSMARAFKEN